MRIDVCLQAVLLEPWKPSAAAAPRTLILGHEKPAPAKPCPLQLRARPLLAKSGKCGRKSGTGVDVVSQTNQNRRVALEPGKLALSWSSERLGWHIGAKTLAGPEKLKRQLLLIQHLNPSRAWLAMQLLLIQLLNPL